MINAIKFLFTAHDIRLSFRIANVIMRDELRLNCAIAHLNSDNGFKHCDNSITKMYFRKSHNAIMDLMEKKPHRLIKGE